MYLYITRRLAVAIPTILFIVLLNFCLTFFAPGDQAFAIAGENATPEYVEYVRKEYKLDAPFHEQLLAYMTNLAKGNLGFSFTYRQPVLDLILSRMPATVLLVIAGLLLGAAFGIATGAFSARFYPSRVDVGLNLISLVLFCLPIFWLGLVMVLIFSVFLNWTPAGGMHSLPIPEGFGRVLDLGYHMILPTITLMLHTFPTYFKLTRNSVIEALNEDYVVTARAIGLGEKVVFFRHCLRNALLPNLTVIGLTIGSVFSGALLTETVFSWPGVGSLMYDAVLQRDLPLVMGIFTISALCVVFFVLVTDLLYGFVDPRIRHD